jgi:hypothetical protein
MESSKPEHRSDSANHPKSEKPKSTIDELNELDQAIHLEEKGLDEVKVDLNELNRMAEEDETLDDGESRFDTNNQ